MNNGKILKSTRDMGQILMVVFIFVLSSCIAKNDVVVTIKIPPSSGLTVTKIQVVNNQIIITGTSLNTINTVSIKEGGVTTNLQIESKNNTSLVGNTLVHFTFSAGRIYDFILTSPNLSSTYTVNFSLCSSTLGGKGFDCSTAPLDKEVLAYDNASGLWKPKIVYGLTYQGVWNATTAFPAATTAGEYYLVSVANAPYVVGDWIVFNGTTFQRINNSTPITSLFTGRTGVVTGNKGDYILTQLGDVDLTTTPPIANQVLKYDGVNWIAGTILATESDPSALAFAQSVLPTCGAGQVLNSDGTNFSCVIDKTAGPFSGTANRTVITDATGAISVSSVSSTAQGYLLGATSDIQTQLDAKEISTNLAGDVRNTVLTGLSTLVNMAISATDSVLVAFGKLQAQVSSNTTSASSKADLTNATQTITTAVVTGLSLPSNGVDAANKNYVLSFGQWNKNANGIDYAGNVGVGTTTPGSKLEIQGSALSRLNVIAAGATVDLSLSNTHVLRAPAASVITLSNALQGGTYTLVITDVTSRLYTFTGGCDNTYFNPANIATTQRTTYTIMVGDDPDANGIPDCFISWTTGFN